MATTFSKLSLLHRPSTYVVAMVAALLTGCAGPGVPTNYAPASIKSASGNLSVGSFQYVAKDRNGNPMAPDIIRNTALGTVRLDRSVATYVRDGVFAELRIMGVKVNDPAKVLTGVVEEFLVDDLGYSVDWTLRVKYTLTDSATKAVLYDAVKSTNRKTAKMVNPFGALNETLKLSAEQLVDDVTFTNAIR
jgi:hypothetical protein